MRKVSRQREWQKKNPAKHAAQQTVAFAVKHGLLKRAAACELCGESELPIFAHHHHGYDEQHVLDVQWLCDYCHRTAHFPNRSKETTALQVAIPTSLRWKFKLVAAKRGQTMQSIIIEAITHYLSTKPRRTNGHAQEPV